MTEALATLFEGKEIRTLERAGEPWFPIVDLAEAWGLDRTTPHKILMRNDEAFRGFVCGISMCDKMSPSESGFCVNERGLYLLIGRITTGKLKNKDAAAAILRFQRWVPELIQQYRKKEIVPVAEERMNLVHELSKAKEIAGLTGANLQIMQAAALRKCGLKEYADALTPSLLHGEAGTWLNPTQIGARCGHSAREVNNFLEWHRFQYRGPDQLWRLTDKGELHGEEYPFETVSKHVEIRIRWRESILVASGLIREQSETLARV
jgi:prophage antirepressor-like protein